MSDEFCLVAARLHDVADYRELFVEPDEKAVKTVYRAILRVVHPDRVSSAYQDEAGVATDRLTKLYNNAIAALRAGTFDRPTPQLVLRSATMRHECAARRDRFFDMTRGYVARTHHEGEQYDSIVKIAKTPRDNELLAAEADALKQLNATDAEHAVFYPMLLDSFAVASGRLRLRANAMVNLDGFVNLEEVRQRYPNGLDPLDMAWIWRRVLWALGGAHESGVLHGALVPSHIMIHPTLHGVVLIDWCYSLRRAGDVYPSLKAVVGSHRDWYPEHVLQRQPAKESLDTALAAQSMQFAMGKSTVPGSMKRYFETLSKGNSDDSAYDALEQFDRILEHLGAPYYPRSYRPLAW